MGTNARDSEGQQLMTVNRLSEKGRERREAKN